MHFFKYHGAGNDFILIDNRNRKVEGKAELARRFCHRRFGIGADGVVFLEKSRKADARMVIYNSDGSQAEMCGNALRCFAKHLYERGIVKKREMDIETKAGTKKVWIEAQRGKVESVKVDMGRPLFERERIPALGKGLFMKQSMNIDDREFSVSALNTGVPHAVIFVDDVESISVKEYGSRLRNDRIFPEGANVDFVQPLGDNAFSIRTYERGVEDETWACGTGIAASAVVAVVLGLADSKKSLRMQARGGTLSIDVEREGEEIGKVYMSGPAKFVFEGKI